MSVLSSWLFLFFWRFVVAYYVSVDSEYGNHIGKINLRNKMKELCSSFCSISSLCGVVFFFHQQRERCRELYIPVHVCTYLHMSACVLQASACVGLFMCVLFIQGKNANFSVSSDASCQWRSTNCNETDSTHFLILTCTEHTYSELSHSPLTLPRPLAFFSSLLLLRLLVTFPSLVPMVIAPSFSPLLNPFSLRSPIPHVIFMTASCLLLR